MILLNIKTTLVNFIKDQDYYIGIYQDHLYLYQYNSIETFNSNYLCVSFPNFKIIITGQDFLVQKMLKEEILIKGVIQDLKIEYA